MLLDLWMTDRFSLHSRVHGQGGAGGDRRPPLTDRVDYGWTILMWSWGLRRRRYVKWA